MEHIDSETLALMAMGEAAASPGQREHLAACGLCQSELSALRQTVSVARSTLGEGVLTAPSASVWTAIHRELGLAADVRPPSAAVAPVTHIDSPRRRRLTLRSILVPVTASAAAAALVAGGILGWGASAPVGPRPVDPATTLASAQLDPLPEWQGASGSATVLERAGERIVSVTVEATAGNGMREVWLLTPGADGLISLGLMQGDSGEFVIPAGVDLAEYPIVDVSEEPVDGNPAHSGDSVVRGILDV